MQKTKPVISVILEWDNVQVAGDARALRMLAALKTQLAQLPYPTEVLVCFDSRQVPARKVGNTLEEQLGMHPGDSRPIRLIEAPGKRYYGLKNEGAQRARGEILVFFDSDVVPEKDWLFEITRLFFEGDNVEVVIGSTHVVHRTFAEKAFALGWVYPAKKSRSGVEVGAFRLIAGNIAIRRETFLQHPFPELPPGVSRGSCAALGRKFKRLGIPIWKNHRARTEHPAPKGLGRWVERALVHGRDEALRSRAAGRSRRETLAQPRWR
jgi:glycosyltransferase involved in cell wall biosynthesis